MIETLTVTCFECQRVFPTPLQVDRATLEALVFTDTYECPHCGAMAAYGKADHAHHLMIDDVRAKDHPVHCD